MAHAVFETFLDMSNKTMMEIIFKKSLTQSPEIMNEMKPLYLEWSTLTHGIVAARKVYEELVNVPPPCLELHKKMIYLENIQPKLNKKSMRFALTRACADFGEVNVGVWMDICKFEIKSGDEGAVSIIFWQARNNLLPHLVEEFLSEFSLIRTIPVPMLK